ncbi:MAG: 4Fe-4S binding protein, partial [Victivallaceae bacterium]
EIYDSDGKKLSGVIQTNLCAQGISGFGGAIPMLLLESDGKVTDVIYLPNQEDDMYWSKIIDGNLKAQFIGKSLPEISHAEFDAVTGATRSSRGVIDSIKTTARQVAVPTTAESGTMTFYELVAGLNLSQFIIASAVILLAAAAAIFHIKNSKLRNVILILDVAVLGVWSGNFVSLNSCSNLLANGLSRGSLIAGIMLFFTLILPIFTGKNFYCFHLCPLGAAQELCGKIIPKKSPFLTGMLKFAPYIRGGIFGLMLILWSLNLGVNLAGYELFTALTLNIRHLPLFSILLLVLGCSMLVPRPYCRFLCPTGFLISYITEFKNLASIKKDDKK